MDTFSIIIPVYNVKKYLDECMYSVISQYHKNLEIILIDDGSTDRSEELCDLYQKEDPRIKVIHQDNKGLSEARNRGLDATTGKYVMFLDSDDYLANNNVISDFANIFEEHDCDMIYGVYNGFVDDDYKSCTYEIYPKILKIDNVQAKNLDIEEVIQLLFDKGNYYSSSTIKIYKRCFIENNRLRFKPDLYLEDEEWTPRALLNCRRIYFYDKEFYRRRIREDSIMTTTRDDILLKRIEDMIEIANDMTKYTRNHCKSNELKKTFEDYYKAFYKGCINISNKINDVDIKSRAKTIIGNMKRL